MATLSHLSFSQASPNSRSALSLFDGPQINERCDGATDQAADLHADRDGDHGGRSCQKCILVGDSWAEWFGRKCLCCADQAQRSRHDQEEDRLEEYEGRQGCALHLELNHHGDQQGRGCCDTGREDAIEKEIADALYDKCDEE